MKVLIDRASHFPTFQSSDDPIVAWVENLQKLWTNFRSERPILFQNEPKTCVFLSS